MSEALLEVRDLSVTFGAGATAVQAVRAVGQPDGEALHVENGFGVGHGHTRRASFGSSRSRSPSPTTLTASTVSARQMPGKKMLCG